MMTGYGMGFGGFIWMIFFWVIVIGGSIALLAAIFPKITTSKNRSEPDVDPLKILKQRYARGEISKEEFETIRHDLEQA